MVDVYVHVKGREDTAVARTVGLIPKKADARADLDAEGGVIGFELLDVGTVTIDGKPVVPDQFTDTRAYPQRCGSCGGNGRSVSTPAWPCQDCGGGGVVVKYR